MVVELWKLFEQNFVHILSLVDRQSLIVDVVAAWNMRRHGLHEYHAR